MAKGSSGGIGGSGLHGFIGTGVMCPSTDTSMYCSVVKMFNLLMMGLFFFYLLYLAYNYLNNGKRRRK
jgi:hypothetical protein